MRSLRDTGTVLAPAALVQVTQRPVVNDGRVLVIGMGIGSECPERSAQKKGVLPKVVPGGKHLRSANTPWISEHNRRSGNRQGLFSSFLSRPTAAARALERPAAPVDLNVTEGLMERCANARARVREVAGPDGGCLMFFLPIYYSTAAPRG